MGAAEASVLVDLPRAAEVLQLDERLRRIPATAKVRGLFFHHVDAQLRKRGLASLGEWQQLAPSSYRVHLLYPVSDLVRALAFAGALVSPDPREGMRELFHGAAPFAADTWFGRVFRALLKPDPLGALRWIERSRDYISNHGHWRLEVRGPGHAMLHMFDEYMFIDSVHRGGCEGLLDACGAPGEVRAEMDGMFRGRLDIRWSERR